MNQLVSLLEILWSKVILPLQNLAKLKDLRTKHNDCTILSASLHNVNLGNNVSILSGVYLSQVGIGSFSYVSNGSCLSNVEIGRFCSISQNVRVGLAPHPSRIFVSTYPAFYSDRNSGCRLSFRTDKIFDDAIPKTIIENDVWIGMNVIIPGGIHVGTGAIIAAGSVVTKDVPSYAIVGGNPAKIIRYRFSDKHINLLLDSEWWNWSVEKIKMNVDIFSNIERFNGDG